MNALDAIRDYLTLPFGSETTPPLVEVGVLAV
jgi:hypothetical protein